MRLVVLASLCAFLAAAAGKVEKGFTPLFNGKDLTGWTKAKENEGTFVVKDGAIVANGPRCHLFYTGPAGKADFKNFELKIDVMTQPKSNGGIYFHTAYQDTGWPAKGFEVQVNNSHGDWRKTGGLYAVQDNKEPFEDGKWLTAHIVVKDNTVTIFVDGRKTAEWTQPVDWKGIDQFPDRRLASGTIALQGHDPGSTVYYKNIRIKQLK
jgi:hypothetical protein